MNAIESKLLYTYGNFILINTRHTKNESKIQTNATHSSRTLFNLQPTNN